MADRQNEISTLNSLIATLIDSINGYEDAAANARCEPFPANLPRPRGRAPAGRRGSACRSAPARRANPRRAARS